jgi:hypothetical protein
VLLPLTTYALLLLAGVLSVTSLVGNRTRILLAVVGIVQVVLLVSWTVTSDCVGTWCVQKGSLDTWLAGPVLLSAALAVAVTEAVRHARGQAHRAP